MWRYTPLVSTPFRRSLAILTGPEELEAAWAYRVYQDPAALLRHPDEINYGTARLAGEQQDSNDLVRPLELEGI